MSGMMGPDAGVWLASPGDAALDVSDRLASLSETRISESGPADEIAVRLRRLRRARACRLQRAIAAGLGAADAGVGCGDPTELPAAAGRRLPGGDRPLSRDPGQRPVDGSCHPVCL